MQRVIAVIAGALLTGALAGSVVAAPNGHILGASGWRLSPDGVPAFEFKASAQISPGSALGTYRFGNATLDVKGAVTCGKVAGNIAVIGGRIIGTTDPLYSGGYFLTWFVDGGATIFGNWGPDQVTLTDLGGGTSPTEFGSYPDLPDDFPAHCPPAAGAGFDQAVATYGLRTVLGDVVVH